MKRYQKSASTDDGLSLLYGTLGGNVASLEVGPFVQTLDVDPFLDFLNGNEPGVPPVGLKSTGNPTEGEILRGWIDEWLDTGKGEDGEDPRRRDFKRAANVGEAVHKYSTRGKIRLLGVGGSLHLWIEEYETPRKFGLRPLLAPPNESYASEQLVFFLLSDVRFKLAKCRTEECGTYFLLNHWKRLYKQGTFCDTCQRRRSHESAKRATAQEREEIRYALHEAAAKRFRKEITANPLWYSSEALKKRVAAFLNTKFLEEESFWAAYPKGVTGKWVANAKNWEPIGIAAKGGK